MFASVCLRRLWKRLRQHRRLPPYPGTKFHRNMDDFSSTSSASSAPELRFGKIDDLSSRAAAAIDAARKWLFSKQHEEGYWCGELEADTTLESDYILVHALLGTGTHERFQKCANYVLRHQNEDGGWPTYNGGPSNISASVKAYFALKLTGYKLDHPALRSESI